MKKYIYTYNCWENFISHNPCEKLFFDEKYFGVTKILQQKLGLGLYFLQADAVTAQTWHPGWNYVNLLSNIR
jgi:hypothetical protein